MEGAQRALVGVVRLRENSSVTSSAERTATTNVAGTPRYMAPEQLLGEPPVPASDLWAIGVMLYRLLSGAFPYDSPTMAGQMLAMMKGCPALDAVAPRVPRELAAIVTRALGHTLEERWGSVRELAMALAPFREESEAPSPAPPPSAPSPPVTVTAPRRTPRAAVSMALAAAAALALLWLAMRAQPGTSSSSSRPVGSPIDGASMGAGPAPVSPAFSATSSSSAEPRSSAASPLARTPAPSPRPKPLLPAPTVSGLTPAPRASTAASAPPDDGFPPHL